MRPLIGLALAGLAGLPLAAAQDAAQVYILTSHPATLSSFRLPQIPRQVARHIFLQRASSSFHVADLPDAIDEETALEYIALYGKPVDPLFGDGNVASGSGDRKSAPSQLVILLEGITEKIAIFLKEALRKMGHEPSFTVSDAPSSLGNKHLVDVEFGAAGVSRICDLEAAVNPYNKTCWPGQSLVVQYDVAKRTSTIQSLVDNLPTMLAYINNHDLEAALVLLPESTRSAKHNYWGTNAPTELRRRLLGESVISESGSLGSAAEKAQVQAASAQPSLLLPSLYAWAATYAEPTAKLGQCFQSYNGCVTATANCTGHGVCADKYAVPGQDNSDSGSSRCFVCSCLATLKTPGQEGGPHVRWGGASCQKRDVSSPFWLIASVTVLLTGVVTLCIGMLFSVGEEKLPGVIGAGVSRGSK